MSFIKRRLKSSKALIVGFSFFAVVFLVAYTYLTWPTSNPYRPVRIQPQTIKNTASSTAGNVAFFNNENYTDAITDAANYQVMVIQYNGTSGTSTYSPSFVAALHAANPNVKVLMYIDPYFGRLSDTNGWGVCVPWSKTGNSASAYPGGNDPSWFLKDQSGNPVEATTGADYLMDKGNSSYQQACLTHTINLAKPAGFDGVYWDNMDAQLYYVPAGESFPSYPTAASWQTASDSFLQYAESQLHANGLLSTANVDDSTGNGDVWRQYGQYLDESEGEGWTTTSTTTINKSSNWLTEEGDDLWSEQNNKFALQHSYSGTEPGNTFGLASLLLVANSKSSYSTSNSSTNGQCYGSTGCEANYSEYTTAQQLGAPSTSVSPAITTGSTGSGTSIYSRKFANGIVIVNPTTGTISNQSLGGTYTGSCGSATLTNITSVTLASNTGCILITAQSPSQSTSSPASTPTSTVTPSTNASSSSKTGSNTSDPATNNPSGDSPASTSVLPNGPDNVINLSQPGTVPVVSGMVTLSTPKNVKKIIYMVDGKVVNSPNINTNNLYDGTHTIEEIITESNGKVIVEKSVIKVDDHKGYIKNSRLKYGDVATYTALGSTTITWINVIVACFWLILFRNRKQRMRLAHAVLYPVRFIKKFANDKVRHGP